MGLRSNYNTLRAQSGYYNTANQAERGFIDVDVGGTEFEPRLSPEQRSKFQPEPR